MRELLGVPEVAEEEGRLPHGRRPGAAGDPDFRHAVVDVAEQDAAGLVTVLGASAFLPDDGVGGGGEMNTLDGRLDRHGSSQVGRPDTGGRASSQRSSPARARSNGGGQPGFGRSASSP